MSREIICSLFYMTVVCFGVNFCVCENLSGMKKVEGMSVDKISVPAVVPIISDFPCFLNSCASRDPAKWTDALANISDVVSFLLADQKDIDISVARPAIIGVSYNAFDSLLNFCDSEYCDGNARTVITNLLKVAVLILRNTVSGTDSGGELIAQTLEKLVTEEFPARKQLILKSDFGLFDQLSSMLGELSDYD